VASVGYRTIRFVMETLIDELAVRAKPDPSPSRLKLLDPAPASSAPPLTCCNNTARAQQASAPDTGGNRVQRVPRDGRRSPVDVSS